MPERVCPRQMIRAETDTEAVPIVKCEGPL